MAVAKGETRLYITSGDNALFLLKPKDGVISTETLPSAQAAQVLAGAHISGQLFQREDHAGYSFQGKDEEFEVVFPDRSRLDYAAVIKGVEAHEEQMGLTVVLR